MRLYSVYYITVGSSTCTAAYSNVIYLIQSHLVGKLLNLIHVSGTHVCKKDCFLICYEQFCIYGWKLFLVDGNPLEYYCDKGKPGDLRCHILPYVQGW